MTAETEKHGSYYDVLKIHPGASDEEVRCAYRQLVKIYHPDLNRHGGRLVQAEHRLRLLNEAYEALRTRENRLRYNMMIKTAPRAENDNPRPAGQGGFWRGLIRSFFAPRRKSGEAGHG